MKIDAKIKTKNCDHCKDLKEKKSVVDSVEVLKINTLKYAKITVANALIPQVPKKASIPKPMMKLSAKK